MMSPDCHIESLFSVITYILETLELSDQKSLNKNIFLDNFKKHIDLIDRHKSNDSVSEGAGFDVKGNGEDCFPGVDEDKTNENSASKTEEVENVDNIVMFYPLDEDKDAEALNKESGSEVNLEDVIKEDFKDEVNEVTALAQGNEETIGCIGEDVKEECTENDEGNGKTHEEVYEAGKGNVKNKSIQCHGECGDSSCRRVFYNKLARKSRYCLQAHIRNQVGRKRLERKQRDAMPCHGECGDESCMRVYRNNWEKQRHIDAKTYIPKACHICRVIPKGKSKDSLIKHLEEHEGGWKGKSRCKICLKSFPTEEIEEHQCQPGVVCPICGKLLRTQSQLPKHVESVHGKLNLDDFRPCHICGKDYRSAEMLRVHIKKIHTEKVACPHCGALVRNLKTHIAAMHTLDQDKEFQCQDCGKGFDKNEKLEKHRMNVHLKLQPYKCRYECDIAYNDISNRNQHEKKKHGKLFVVVRDEKIKASLNGSDISANIKM